MSKRLTVLALALLALVAAAAQGSDSIPGRIHVTPVAPSTNVTLTPPKGTDEKVVTSRATRHRRAPRSARTRCDASIRTIRS